jgi:hypothetical protein
VLEANLRSPYVLGYDKHPDVAERIHRMFAGQIAVAAGVN